jgi:hypothetical protein
MCAHSGSFFKAGWLQYDNGIDLKTMPIQGCLVWQAIAGSLQSSA